MTKPTDIDCHGCKISMFCSRKNKDSSQPCETNLWAVCVAFVVPLLGIVLILALAQDRVGEGWSALSILLFLALYFLALKLMKIEFKK